MDLILHKKYFYDAYKLNKCLGPNREDSIAHLFVQNRSQIMPGHYFYKPSKVGRNMNDGYGVIYNKRLDRIMLKTLIEYKYQDEDTWEVLSQQLAYYMPVRCGILRDGYNYEVDKFRYFEILDSFKYCLLDLKDPEVKAIIDEFAEIFESVPHVSACKAKDNNVYAAYARRLVKYLKICDIEEMIDHEIVADWLKEYCKDNNMECNIKFVDDGIDNGTNVAG